MIDNTGQILSVFYLKKLGGLKPIISRKKSMLVYEYIYQNNIVNHGYYS